MLRKKSMWYVGITLNFIENISFYPLAQTVICALTLFPCRIILKYEKIPSTCPYAYQPVLISCLCFALSLHLASLPRRLLTPWPPLACPLDGRRGRTAREELITSTITTAPLPGLGQLCRYSRSEGWLDSMHGTGPYSGPCHGLDLCVGPLPLFPPVFLLCVAIKNDGKRYSFATSKSLFLSLSLSSFQFFPTLLYVFLLLSSILFGTLDEVQLCIGHAFLNPGMELQPPLFPPFSHFYPVFPLVFPCLSVCKWGSST